MSAKCGTATIAVCAVGIALMAQTQPQQPVFRGGASLVRVDVTVTDRHGEPVTTLTADDFEVQEDGVPQTVETLKLVSADGRPVEGDDTSLEIRSPEHAAAEAARDEIRVFLIFWDEYHIGRFGPAINGRKTLSEFLRSAFAPTDLVALMDPLLPTDAIRWTRNHNQLAEAAQKLEGRFRVYMPVRSVLEEGQLARRDVERLRSEVTISALKSAASYLGGLREGRKAIIFISEGLPGLYRSDEMSLFEDLVRAANDNNTAIYTVDPQGLTGGVADVLRILADNTGAQAFLSNTPAKAMRQIVKDASAFYLLGYASTKNPVDGKFHQIKVRVKQSRLEVRARQGYWAPSQTDLDRAAREGAPSTPTEITTALAAVATLRPERPVDLWVGSARDSKGAAQVTVAWTPRLQPNSAALSGGTIAVVGRDAAGTRDFEAPLEARRLAFPGNAGSVELQITVRDSKQQTIAEETRTVVVPDLENVELALSTPAVLLARNPTELRNLSDSSTPFAGREFARTDRLFVRFDVYGNAASHATITARLLARTGSTLLTLRVEPPKDAIGPFQIDLPLASIARGDYLIAIAAEAGDDRAEALVPLRIVS